MSLRFLSLSIIYYCCIIGALIFIIDNNNNVSAQALTIVPDRFILEYIFQNKRYIATGDVSFGIIRFNETLFTTPPNSYQRFEWINYNNNTNGIGKLRNIGANKCIFGGNRPNDGVVFQPCNLSPSDGHDELLWIAERSPGLSYTIRFRHFTNTEYCLAWGGSLGVNKCINNESNDPKNYLFQRFNLKAASLPIRPLSHEQFILQWSPSFYKTDQQKIIRIAESIKTFSNDAVIVSDYDGTQYGTNNNRRYIWKPIDKIEINRKIQLSSSNQCFDQWNNDGVSIGMFDCTDGTQLFQQWKIRYTRMIQYAGSTPNNQEKCLRIDDDNPGALIKLSPCDDFDAYQQFDFIPSRTLPLGLPILHNNDQFTIQWTDPNNNGVNGGLLSLYLFDSSSTPDNAIAGNTINLASTPDGSVFGGNKYTWIETDSNNGIGKIKLSKNNLCFDLPYGRTNNGNAITMYDCDQGGQLNQQWKLRTITNNNNLRMIQFGSSAEEKCLGVDLVLFPYTIKLFDCDQNDTKQQFNIVLI